MGGLRRWRVEVWRFLFTMFWERRAVVVGWGLEVLYKRIHIRSCHLSFITLGRPNICLLAPTRGVIAESDTLLNGLMLR